MPGISITIFRPITRALQNMQVDHRALFEFAGIDPQVLADDEARIPLELYHAFWPAAARFMDDPAFGIHLAEAFQPSVVNILGYLMLSSATVGQGLERVSRYQRVVFGDEFILLEDRDSYSFVRFEFGTADDTQLSIEAEFRAAIVVEIVDWITAPDLRPSEVRFSHRPLAPISEYERVLGCPVKFEAKETGLVLPPSTMNEPSMSANAEMAQMHEEWAEQHLAQLKDRATSRQVKKLLMSQLDREPCRLIDVARSLHMSARTLQRRLTEEGTSFNGLFDELRREFSLKYLARPGVCLAEIAYLVGFSDTSALTRAVRRWTGETPLEYRRSKQTE